MSQSPLPGRLGPKSISKPAAMTITLNVNGQNCTLTIAPWTTLLDALRDRLNLTGTKKGAITASAAPARCSSKGGGSIPA